MRRHPVVLLTLLALAQPPAARAGDAPKGAAASVNAFTADLLKRVAASGGNLFVSPHSIAVALAMTRAGAAGETAKQIDAVFHLPPDAGAAFRELTRALGNVPTDSSDRRGNPLEAIPVYSLSIANGLFTQQGWPFKDAFRLTIATDYAAEFRELDFKAPPAARAAINGWVEEKTRQRIKDIVPAGLPTPDTRMVLANAIHFQAQWAEPFPEGSTTDGPFAVAPGKDVTVERMRKTSRFAHGETPEAEVLELPYRAGAMSMVVVLPKAKDGLDALIASLTPESLAALTSGLAHRKVALELPKFTFTTPLDVTATLNAMGMPLAFSDRADFSGITDEKPLFIGAVLHKAFVAVDEKGTEAAAATVVMLRAGSAPRPDQPTPFVVDHPFLFLIRHRATGAILFAGRVVDPTSH